MTVETTAIMMSILPVTREAKGFVLSIPRFLYKIKYFRADILFTIIHSVCCNS